ncbi:MAG TPA: hypothetical protein VN659_09100 [Pyrinomonadaceae bacterium]|nr:hypothetical protein [Pyrinomonadaceae bacterium]
MNVASLPKARALAESQTVDSVLQIIVRSLAEQSHVALARVWLHLVASAGNLSHNKPQSPKLSNKIIKQQRRNTNEHHYH